MGLIDKLAEQKISEAMANGEFDDLPGQGRPLCLEDDSLVPEELRVGYHLLKNAGYLPSQLCIRKDITSVEALLAQTRTVEERTHLSRRRNALLMQLSSINPQSLLFTEPVYMEKLKQQ